MTRPACDGEYETFFALIDTPGNRFVRRDAARICVGCDLAPVCLPENLARGGDDAAWAYAVTTELADMRKRANRVA